VHIAGIGCLMLRLLVSLLLIPSMLLPSGVCICHYFTLPTWSTTIGGDDLAEQCADGDKCPPDAQGQGHPQPGRGENQDDHSPCGPEIKALVGSTLVHLLDSPTELHFIGSSIPFETSALPCSASAYPSRGLSPGQRQPIYLSLLTLRI